MRCCIKQYEMKSLFSTTGYRINLLPLWVTWLWPNRLSHYIQHYLNAAKTSCDHKKFWKVLGPNYFPKSDLFFKLVWLRTLPRVYMYVSYHETWVRISQWLICQEGDFWFYQSGEAFPVRGTFEKYVKTLPQVGGTNRKLSVVVIARSFSCTGVIQTADHEHSLTHSLTKVKSYSKPYVSFVGVEQTNVPERQLFGQLSERCARKRRVCMYFLSLLIDKIIVFGFRQTWINVPVIRSSQRTVCFFCFF